VAGDGWPGAGEWQAAGGIKFGSLEVTEVRFPLFFKSHEFRPDSGGAGQYRGGPGGIVEMVVETAEPAVGNTAGDGVRHGACGILGGEDGLPHRYILYSGNQAPRAIKTKEVGLVIRPGDRAVLESGGGGGWGDPAQRDPAAITDDVENGFTTGPGDGVAKPLSRIAGEGGTRAKGVGGWELAANRRHSSSISAAPYSTGAASSTKMLVTRPARGARIWFITFIASMISRVWPSATVSPTRTKGGAPGSAAR